jgi:LYR motif-containing protein 4
MMYADALEELAVIRRSAVMNRLYGGWTLAVEKQKEMREA